MNWQLHTGDVVNEIIITLTRSVKVQVFLDDELVPCGLFCCACIPVYIIAQFKHVQIND